MHPAQGQQLAQYQIGVQRHHCPGIDHAGQNISATDAQHLDAEGNGIGSATDLDDDIGAFGPADVVHLVQQIGLVGRRRVDNEIDSPADDLLRWLAARQ